MWLFWYLILGEYGIKGLFWCKEYYNNYSLNSETGELKKDMEK